MLSNTCASIVNCQHVPETSIAQPADNIVGTTSIGGAVLEGLDLSVSAVCICASRKLAVKMTVHFKNLPGRAWCW